jgi:hypothetical protein
MTGVELDSANEPVPGDTEAGAGMTGSESSAAEAAAAMPHNSAIVTMRLMMKRGRNMPRPALKRGLYPWEHTPWIRRLRARA